jgi:hypothetical protein
MESSQRSDSTQDSENPKAYLKGELCGVTSIGHDQEEAEEDPKVEANVRISKTKRQIRLEVWIFQNIMLL